MNTLSATLIAITASEHLSILTASVADDIFHLLLAEVSDVSVGSNVTVAFKETEVVLSSAPTATTANIGRATVTRIERGSVLSQITLSYSQTKIVALVPTLTFDTLCIEEEDEVFWMVNPGEISLLRGTHGI